MYVKPNMSVIELQLKENIAAVPTTVYKGATRPATGTAVNLALSEEGSGIKDNDYLAS